MKTAHYWAAIALLLLATGALYGRGDHDSVPVSTPLDQFPVRMGNWTGTDEPISQDALDVLGKGFFLSRTYAPTDSDGTAKNGTVGLFIGYFPTQRSGQSIHSPQNCLPGAGWTFESAGTTPVTDASGKTSQVGDYIISNGASRDEVLYWYQSHGRAIANDYRAKVSMLTDSIRYGRSDAALVRVVAPMLPGESREATHARVLRFTEEMIPLLPAYIPN